MKIGILGAPGSGKSDFAKTLAEELGTGPHDHGGIITIDNYVETLRYTTGMEYGEFGNFIDDMQVVFKRREWELDWAFNKARNTITVGTVLDSVIHNFIRSEDIGRSRKELRITHERLRAIASAFGLIYTETWDYDYAFFLDDGSSYSAAMRSLIHTYSAPVLTFLPEVPDDERAKLAAKAIRALEEEYPTATAELRVRRSGPIGEADGDSSEPVPDVPEQRGTSDDS